MPTQAQFGLRAIFVASDEEDDRLSATYWLATPMSDDIEENTDFVTVDFLEMASKYCQVQSDTRISHTLLIHAHQRYFYVMTECIWRWLVDRTLTCGRSWTRAQCGRTRPPLSCDARVVSVGVTSSTQASTGLVIVVDSVRRTHSTVTTSVCIKLFDTEKQN